MTQRIGIVGGSGYIGSSLARHLSKKFEVTVLDIKSPEDPNLKMSFQRCDVRDYENSKRALQDMDLVIHVAIIQIPQINQEKKLGYEVNVIGTQNICRIVEENPRIKGMILAGTWHTIGERDIVGTVDETFGFRPDKVEDRARLYALSKMAQESIVRLHDEMSKKIYGIIRMGTVLGEGMPKKTAANIFIDKGLKGDPITPFRHSMYRPMLYVDIKDICRAFEIYALKILSGECQKSGNSLANIINVYHPKPITILNLAEIVRKVITDYYSEKVNVKIEIVDKGEPVLFTDQEIKKIEVNISKARNFLGMKRLSSPQESITRIARARARALLNS